MPGLLGLIRNRVLENSEIELLTGAINLSGNLTVNHLETTGGFFAVSSLSVIPLQGNRLFEKDRWVLLFAGDLIDYREIPHYEIIRSIEEKKYEYFDTLEGVFAIAAFNKQDKKVVLVTDRRSQYPLYLYLSKDTLCFSTELSVFCRLERFDFDKRWLWEYLFFNFPVSKITFAQNVDRIQEGRVVVVDLNSLCTDEVEYTKPFKTETSLVEGKKALSFALDVFRNRVPAYFTGSGEIACPLTSGWDGRTVLALAPRREQVTAYTYGVPGCEDIEKAAKIAYETGTNHIRIPFDYEVVKELPHYMLETVYVSSGAQGILRGTLLFVYETLTQSARNFPLTLSGMCLDGLFRGHFAYPPLISYDMASLFEGGSSSIEKSKWFTFFDSEYSIFEDHISNQLESLRARFGELTSSSHHLSYYVYLVATRYFGGEVSIANNFTTIRVPAWDKRIIEVAYSIKPGTMSFSQYSGHIRGSHDEMVLQSYILSKVARDFSRIPVGSNRPDFVIRGEYSHFLYKVYNYLKRRLLIRPKPYAPLENWEHWIILAHKDFIYEIVFSANSEIRRYVSDQMLRQLREKPDIHWIGKLATVEVILRLIRTKWQRFW
jgi:asparagine synthetase B (glutamine-hydrolysing)